MKMVQCNRGHYYDLDLYPDGCPHCRIEGVIPGGDEKTVPQSYAAPSPAPTAGSSPDLTRTVPLEDDDEKTTRVDINPNSGEDFAVGWLVCIKGDHYGRDFHLHTGRNFIGRSREMDVCLEGDKSVSRTAQAIVIYDPKSHRFMVQAGESRDLFYLNGEVVLESKGLKARDRLDIGNETLMFIPFVDEDFDWTK